MDCNVAEYGGVPVKVSMHGAENHSTEKDRIDSGPTLYQGTKKPGEMKTILVVTTEGKVRTFTDIYDRAKFLKNLIPAFHFINWRFDTDANNFSHRRDEKGT